MCRYINIHAQTYTFWRIDACYIHTCVFNGSTLSCDDHFIQSNGLADLDAAHTLGSVSSDNFIDKIIGNLRKHA